MAQIKFHTSWPGERYILRQIKGLFSIFYGASQLWLLFFLVSSHLHPAALFRHTRRGRPENINLKPETDLYAARRFPPWPFLSRSACIGPSLKRPWKLMLCQFLNWEQKKQLLAKRTSSSHKNNHVCAGWLSVIKKGVDIEIMIRCDWLQTHLQVTCIHLS